MLLREKIYLLGSRPDPKQTSLTVTEETFRLEVLNKGEQVTNYQCSENKGAEQV